MIRRYYGEQPPIRESLNVKLDRRDARNRFRRRGGGGEEEEEEIETARKLGWSCSTVFISPTSCETGLKTLVLESVGFFKSYALTFESGVRIESARNQCFACCCFSSACLDFGFLKASSEKIFVSKL